MEKLFGFTAALLGALGVGLGAFGAHGLRSRLEPRMLEVFETGVRYHLIHAVALLLVAVLISRHDSAAFRTAGWAFTGGIAVFSGTLYILSVTGMRWLGAITPLGGLALIVGWIALAVGFLKS